jgi:hypothetical protein
MIGNRVTVLYVQPVNFQPEGETFLCASHLLCAFA